MSSTCKPELVPEPPVVPTCVKVTHVPDAVVPLYTTSDTIIADADQLEKYFFALILTYLGVVPNQ